MKQVLVLVAVTFSLCLANFAQDNAALKNIKKVFVGDLGTNPDAVNIREKIRKNLAGSKRFKVVDTPDEADAIFTGTAAVETIRNTEKVTDAQVEWGHGHLYPAGQPSPNINVGGHPQDTAMLIVNGVFRLTQTKTNISIWSFEVKGTHYDGNLTEGVANQVTKQLLKDTKKVDSK
ncbi:MAG TPA: hypothetical protein VFC63_13615 [Blastocatellia bacterium]|nr:hypothetical protein [Blastocatellia bacterium]